jgi:hypothetical protein
VYQEIAQHAGREYRYLRKVVGGEFVDTLSPVIEMDVGGDTDARNLAELVSSGS